MRGATALPTPATSAPSAASRRRSGRDRGRSRGAGGPRRRGRTRRRRPADARFVDEAQRQRARISEAVNRAEEIERRLGLGKAYTAGRRQPLAQNIPRAAAAVDLPGEERFAVIERGGRGALGEDGDAGGGVLNQVLDRLAERGRGLEPADAEPGHRPVLGQRLDEQDLVVRRHRVVERGRAGALVDDSAINLVGDDPKPMPARDRQRRGDFLARGDEAGRVGGGVEENKAGRRRHRARELVRIEAPAGAAVEADRHGASAGDFKRADKIGPRRRGDQRLVTRTDDHPRREFDRVHAADGDEEILGEKAPPPGAAP